MYSNQSLTGQVQGGLLPNYRAIGANLHHILSGSFQIGRSRLMSFGDFTPFGFNWFNAFKSSGVPMKRLYSPFIFGLVLWGFGAQMSASETNPCASAGPGASFCAGALFSRVDSGTVEGLSFWMDKAGYLSKVVVQSAAGPSVDQALVETQILSMVSAQAESVGRAFEFRDLDATTTGVAGFGTLSYSLAKAGRSQAILHSYVLVKGVVIQVISQIAKKGTAGGPGALMVAHRRAVEAIKLTNTDEIL